MAEAFGASGDAIYAKGHGVEFGASDTALGRLTDAWKFTLTWIERNPYLSSVTALLLAWIVYQRRLGRTEVSKMQVEYNAHRDANKQPELPLQKQIGTRDVD